MLGTQKGTEPLIKLKVGPQQQEFEFLVDSGAERSTIQTLPKGCEISSDTMQVIGAKGEPFRVPVTKGVVIETDFKIGVGNLLLVPEAEYNLLGRDLIIELGVNLEVMGKEIRIRLCPLRVEDENKINPEVWYTEDSVGKLDITPFKVKISSPEIPIRVKQYPVSKEGRRGLKPEIERLLEKGLFEPCMSPFKMETST